MLERGSTDGVRSSEVQREGAKSRSLRPPPRHRRGLSGLAMPHGATRFQGLEGPGQGKPFCGTQAGLGDVRARKIGSLLVPKVKARRRGSCCIRCHRCPASPSPGFRSLSTVTLQSLLPTPPAKPPAAPRLCLIHQIPTPQRKRGASGGISPELNPSSPLLSTNASPRQTRFFGRAGTLGEPRRSW